MRLYGKDLILFPFKILKFSVIYIVSYSNQRGLTIVYLLSTVMEIVHVCILILLTVTNVTLAGSWYCRSSTSTGIWTLDRLFSLLLMWTSNSNTWWKLQTKTTIRSQEYNIRVKRLLLTGFSSWRHRSTNVFKNTQTHFDNPQYYKIAILPLKNCHFD